MCIPEKDLVCKKCNQVCATDVTGTAYCVLCGKARYRFERLFDVPFVELIALKMDESKE